VTHNFKASANYLKNEMQFARIHAPSGAGHITVLRWGPSAMLRDTHFFNFRRLSRKTRFNLRESTLLQERDKS